MKKVLFLILTLALAFTSCSNNNSTDAVISFSFNENSRGISIVDMDASYYIVTGSCGQETFDSGKIDTDSPSKTYVIKAGAWSFKATGYNVENQIIGESESIVREIKPGANDSIKLSVREIEGIGNVTFNISYQGDVNLLVQIDGGEKSVMTKGENGSYSLTVSIENGFHDIAIYKDGFDTPLDVFSVRVVTGYDTLVVMEYHESTFGNGYFDISGDITQTPLITFEDGLSEVPINIPFSVKATVERVTEDVTYQWYLNGITIPGETDTTFSIESLDKLSNSLDEGVIEPGTKLNLVLRVNSSTVSWTSDGYEFTAIAALKYPEVTVDLNSSEENIWDYSADEIKTVNFTVENASELFIITYFIDGKEISPLDDSTFQIPLSQSAGKHTVSYAIYSEFYDIRIEKELFSFIIVPVVSLALESEELYNYGSVAGSVTVAPKGEYDIYIRVGEASSENYLIDEKVGEGEFSLSLNSISETGDYEISAALFAKGEDPSSSDALSTSEMKTISVKVPDFSISAEYQKAYQGNGITLHTSDDIRSGEKLYVNGEEMSQYGISSANEITINSTMWPVGNYSFQLEREGVKSAPVVIEILKKPEIRLLANGKEYEYDWHKGEAITFSIDAEEGIELSDIRWTWDENGEHKEENDSQNVTIENEELDYININVEFLADGIPYGTLYQYVYASYGDGEYRSSELDIDKLIVSPGESVTVSYYISDDDFSSNAEVKLELVKRGDDGTEETIESLEFKKYPSEGKKIYTLKEAGAYYVKLSYKYMGNDPFWEWTRTGSIYCTEAGIIPVSADEVYQMIDFDPSEENVAAGTGTLLIDNTDNTFAYYYTQFSETILSAMLEGEYTSDDVLIIDTGSVSRDADVITLIAGDETTYTLKRNGETYTDESGKEWKLLSGKTVSSDGFNGLWRLAELRLDSDFLRAVRGVALEYLNDYDSSKDWAKFLEIESDDSIALNAQFSIRNGILDAYADIALDASFLNTEGGSLSFADIFKPFATVNTQIDTYGNDNIVIIADGLCTPIALQKSESGSALVVYMLRENGGLYEPFFAIPLFSSDESLVQTAGNAHFDSAMTVTFDSIIDMLHKAEERVGEDSVALLSNLFTFSDYSLMNENGLWAISVDAESDAKSAIEGVLGTSYIYLFGYESFIEGSGIYNSYGYTEDGRQYNYYGNGAYLYLDEISRSDSSVKYSISLWFDGLPTVFEGTVTFTRDNSLGLTDLFEVFLSDTDSAPTVLFEFREDGEIWYKFERDDAMHVADYGLKGGIITISTVSDLIPELYGMSVNAGISLGYELSSDGAEIFLVEDKGGNDFGLTLERL